MGVVEYRQARRCGLTAAEQATYLHRLRSDELFHLYEGGPLEVLDNDRPVALGGRALALEIAARDLAGGVITFLVIHGEREEIHALARRLGADDRCENHGLAIRRHHGAVGLTRDLAGFERQSSAAPVETFLVYVKHLLLLSSSAAAGLPRAVCAQAPLPERGCTPWPMP
jgi:hypothetical protein